MALIHNVDYGFLPDLNPECQVYFRANVPGKWSQCHEYAVAWVLQLTYDKRFHRPVPMCAGCLITRGLHADSQR